MLKKIIVISALFLAVSTPAFAQQISIPANGKINVYGTGWDCQRGFKKTGDSCTKVVVPANGKINVYGTGWDCQRGFKKSGDRCIKVDVPANGKINVYGTGWDCQRGFKKAGDNCIKVDIPTNGKINVYGNGWVCNDGFKASGNSCLQMTAAELIELQEQKARLLKAYRANQARKRARSKCETEPDTNSEVCLVIEDTEFNCTEDYDNRFYESCSLELDYELTTDYRGSGSIDVSIECEVEISYEGNNTYYGSDSEDDDETHTLYREDTVDDDFEFDFSFGSYDEVTSVKVSDVSCDITDLSR